MYIIDFSLKVDVMLVSALIIMPYLALYSTREYCVYSVLYKSSFFYSSRRFFTSFQASVNQ